jgi:ATP-binding cassette, subfamily B, bacterial PglK
MLASLYAAFVKDLHRIYQVLPRGLQTRTSIVFLYMVILAIIEVVGVLSLSFLAMSVAAPESLMSEPRMARLINSVAFLRAACSDHRYFVLWVSLSVVVLTVVKNIMAAFVGLQTSRLGEDIALFAGKRILTHYLYSPYMWHLSGDGAAKFQALSWKGSLGTLVIQLLTVYTYAIIAFALFITMISTTPSVIFTTLVAAGILSFMLYKGLKKSVDNAGTTTARLSEQETRAIMSAMNGIREVIIYRQQPTFTQKYLEACQMGVGSRVFLNIAAPIPTWVLEVVGFAIIPAAIWLLIRFRGANMAEIAGTVAIVMLAAWRILPMLNRSLSSLITVRSIRSMAMTCLESVEYTVTHQANPLPEPDPNFRFSGCISFKNVEFRYPGAESAAIHDFTLTIQKGKRLGIIGPSGAGKSTIAGLLSGLMEPNCGRIEVDGQPMTRARLASYVTKVGYVPQAPYIMPGTVAENVAFSQWGKPYDQQRVWKACRMAALDIVESHEKGILIPVGDRGSGLSGGQAQRVAIARVLYADPELLILDEATSSLDQGTESAIMQTINSLPASMTTVIIAHRLSTVAHCDHLVWMEQGRLVAGGPANEILPRYLERLSVLQAEKEETAAA